MTEMDRCPACAGTKLSLTDRTKTCDTCSGSGAVPDARAIEIATAMRALDFAERTRDEAVSLVLRDAQGRMADDLRVDLGHLVITQ